MQGEIISTKDREILDELGSFLLTLQECKCTSRMETVADGQTMKKWFFCRQKHFRFPVFFKNLKNTDKFEVKAKH